MLGYVKIFKPELKLWEYEVYTGYYCGVCKYIGKNYGQLPRMALSYDAAFLALLLASCDETLDAPTQEHCAVHHVKKKTVIRNRAVEYAGDVMLILAWHKLQDDAHDEGKKSAKATLLLLKRAYGKLRRKHPGLCENIRRNIGELRRLENEHCDSIDRVAEPFSKIMATIFREGAELLYHERGSSGRGESCCIRNEETKAGGAFDTDDSGSVALHETFAMIGYHMGKWIYLVDAVDDIEENMESGAYNPLFYRFCWKHGEAHEAFRSRIRETVEFNLYHYLAVVSEQLESLDMKKNKGIIENIVYFGMNRQTEDVLNQSDSET